mgnify:CR=1 FL=1
MHAHATVTQVARTAPSTELTVAAKQGDLEQLTHALAQPGCEVDGRRLGFAAIHLAAKGGHTETISVLLDRGSTVHTKAANGASPLHCAAEANRTQVISMLLARGASVLGDFRYGRPTPFADGHGIALHAVRLTVEHPTRKEAMTFVAKPPVSWRGHFDRAVAMAVGAR